MKFSNLLTDDAVIEEIGRRVAAARVANRLTQAELAEAAGVSKRTVERLENGDQPQLANLIRCLRALDKLEGLERLLPETAVNPIDRLRAPAPAIRVRHSAAAPERDPGRPGREAAPKAGWVWGDQR